MVRKKNKIARKVKPTRAEKIKKEKVIANNPTVVDGTFSKVNLSESYVSLTIGIIVVIFASILTVVFLKQKSPLKLNPPKQEISSQKIEEVKKINNEAPLQSYTIAEGDDLKAISRKFYGSYEYYMEIAKANNIQNADILEIGMVLKIPRVNTKSATSEKITQDTYTVKENEYLWDIAVKAYGDGFKWVEIAKANNLDFPDVIPPGTVLKIPR